MELHKTYKNNKSLTDREITLKLLDNVEKEVNITQKSIRFYNIRVSAR